MRILTDIGILSTIKISRHCNINMELADNWVKITLFVSFRNNIDFNLAAERVMVKSKVINQINGSNGFGVTDTYRGISLMLYEMS